MGIIYRRRGEYSKAEALFTLCLERRKEVLGPNERGTLQTMSGLATNYCKQHDYVQSETLFHQAIAKMTEILGEDDRLTLTSIFLLASMYREKLDFQQAKQCYTACLEKQQKVFGDTHPDTVKTKDGLSRTLDEMKGREEFDDSLAD